MKKTFDPKRNYEQTRKVIGYVPLHQANSKTWQKIGFKSGLEVHQQLNTKEKLFCHCPAGVFHSHNDFDGELIRHMRPTLSEMGEYDGTALMEFKTRKEVIYRINNRSACTYDIDDTPPFRINKEALEYALEISLASNLNIVGEVHITRKQYLDGSIPTGFQRTAIIGVEGELQLSQKKIRLIQLSLEEDSCREISDIGHTRIYKTDRLGMPLIETVTYPDMLTPYELREAAEYIRFLNRSTGKVRTGIGAGREDVNVSCEGGTRVEIKGLAHNRWIPKLSHNEAFRQYALLNVVKLLQQRISNPDTWQIQSLEIPAEKISPQWTLLAEAKKRGEVVYAVNLPGFQGILSHFTQPGQCFADEISQRLKVIACLEQPNCIHSETFTETLPENLFEWAQKRLNAQDKDAQIIFWGPAEDIPTALETIEERCRMAYTEVPRETRKPQPDGTTIFERVLPGADRMYPDTDSAPIPIPDQWIDEIRQRIPLSVAERIQQMNEWKIPKDTHLFLLKKNLAPLIEKISSELEFDPRMVGCFMGQRLKNLEGKIQVHPSFKYTQLFDLFAFLKQQNLELQIARPMLSILMQHPNMDFPSILTSIKFKRRSCDELLAPVSFLIEKFKDIRFNEGDEIMVNWLMGQIRNQAIGNISLREYSQLIRNQVINENHD